MTRQEFIFSNKPPHRFARHIVFWAALALHFIIQNLLIGGPGEGQTHRSFFESFLHLLYFLPLYVTSTYLFLLVILPHTLFKRRYLLFTLITFVLLSAVIAGCYFAGELYIHIAWDVPYNKISFQQNKYHVLVNGIFVPLMMWGIAGGFSLSKKWYEKQKENAQLAQQKIAAEIKLLKIQIHPRFLFHTLTAVQQQVHEHSNEAPEMLLQLSDLLSYLLYESDAPEVLLAKEIDITRTYINLQKASAKNRIDFIMRVSGDVHDKITTPLMLFAATESFFQHFFEEEIHITNGMLEVEIKDKTALIVFDCNLTNNTNADRKLKSIQLQLQNLYPASSEIQISYISNGFMLQWEIPFTSIVTEDKSSVFYEEGLTV